MTPLVTYALLFLLFALVSWFAYHLRRDQRANPLDLITSPVSGRLSASKIGQVVGLIVSTWVIIALASAADLSGEIFGIYLLYVGASDGYGRYLRSKATTPPPRRHSDRYEDDFPRPPKVDPE